MCHVKLKLHALQARQVSQRAVGQGVALQLQLSHFTFGAEVQQRLLGVLPCGDELIDLALRLHARQQRAPRFGQGQTLADLCKGLQVQAVGFQGACFKRIAAPADAHHTPRPVLTLLGVKHQVLTANFNFTVLPLRSDSALHTAQRQWQQIGPQTGVHRVQSHIRRHAHRGAFFDIGSNVQRTAALLQRQAFVHRHPLTQSGEIDIGQIGNHLARPLRGVAGALPRELMKLATHRQPLTQRLGRCEVGTHLVLQPLVVE